MTYDGLTGPGPMVRDPVAVPLEIGRIERGRDWDCPKPTQMVTKAIAR